MLFVCSAKPADLKNAICYNAIYQMEDNMKAQQQTKFTVGDRVIYDSPGGKDHHCKGVVTWVGYNGYEVEWNDGETYDYKFGFTSIRLDH